MMQDSTQVADFLAFAGSKGVKKVYAGVNADVPNEAFRGFIEQCGAQGIAVGALIGNSQWILDRGTPSLDDNLGWIEQYQGSAPDNSTKFEEVHMDIEPWVLEGWDTPAKQAQYVASWQEKISTIANFSRGLDMAVAADLPFWANTIIPSSSSSSDSSDSTTMDVWTLGVVDSATFMTYRSAPAQLLDVAAPALGAGDATGKPVWLAVETTDVGDAALSYFGRTAGALAADLVTVQEGARAHASFAGIAVHDSVGWPALA
ncbi:putative copper amine oxidase n-terminal domain protein [Eutypa lata UCREL1]|uniref:Putative copper amine oxidase n-terminal domain protein n=1 Tax=Eutypa lata (strain UCR-EL1) TaxID=1287681 RepID=M7SRG4_EUTLA|nr:putative copper amine oxidase n-terminal domain protein [Eutypa lata UCREL1]